MSELNEQYIVDEDGNKAGVLLPLEEYERLIADLHDLVVVAERSGENNLILEDINQRLDVDGS